MYWKTTEHIFLANNRAHFFIGNVGSYIIAPKNNKADVWFYCKEGKCCEECFSAKADRQQQQEKDQQLRALIARMMTEGLVRALTNN